MDTESQFAKLDKFIADYEANRPKVLPPAAREYMRRLESDPALSLAFLQRAGIVDEHGDIAQRYRPE